MVESEKNKTSADYQRHLVNPRLVPDRSDFLPETVRHHMNRYKVSAACVKQDDIVVDLCCGTGYGTDILQSAGASKAIGIDISVDAITYARNHYPNCIFVLDDVYRLLRGETDLGKITQPDIVTFFEAIEHIPKLKGLEILYSVRDTLSRDGLFFLSTPRDIRINENPDHITQWTFDELESTLKGMFKEVDIFGQDWISGEFVTDNPQSASFYLAVCSQPITENLEKDADIKY